MEQPLLISKIWSLHLNRCQSHDTKPNASRSGRGASPDIVADGSANGDLTRIYRGCHRRRTGPVPGIVLHPDSHPARYDISDHESAVLPPEPDRTKTKIPGLGSELTETGGGVCLMLTEAFVIGYARSSPPVNT